MYGVWEQGYIRHCWPAGKTTCSVMSWSLKTLCHAITPDCPLIEAACTHAANEQWAWQMADKFGCMFVLAEASSAGGVRLSRHHVGFLAFIYPLFLFFRLPITEICKILNLTNANSAKHAHVANFFSSFRGIIVDENGQWWPMVHWHLIFQVIYGGTGWYFKYIMYGYIYGHLRGSMINHLYLLVPTKIQTKPHQCLDPLGLRS